MQAVLNELMLCPEMENFLKLWQIYEAIRARFRTL